MMRFLKLTIVGFLLIVFFIISLVLGVLFSEVGTNFVWNTTKKFVPEINGEIASGTLGEGLVINDLSLEFPFLQLKINHIETEWNMYSLLFGRLNIAKFDVDEVNLKLPIELANTDPIYDDFFYKKVKAIWNGEDPNIIVESNEKRRLSEIKENNDSIEELKKHNWYIDIPLEVSLEQLKVTNFEMDANIFNLKIKDLSASANLYNHALTNAKLNANEADFFLNKANMPSYATFSSFSINDGFDQQEIQNKIKRLTPVFIPFDIDVEELKLTKSRYHQEGYDTGLMDICIVGEVKGYSIFIKKSDITSEQYGVYQLDGTVELVDYINLDANLVGKVDYSVSDELRIVTPTKAKVKGNLSDLYVDLNTPDEKNINVKLRIDVYDGKLTSDLDLQYDKLQWPLNIDNPDYTLKKGKILFRGDLNYYDLKLQSKYLLPNHEDLNVSIDLVGTKNDFDLNKIMVNLDDNNFINSSLKYHMNNDVINISNLQINTKGNWISLLTDNLIESINGYINSDVVYDINNSFVSISNLDLNLFSSYQNTPLMAKGKLDANLPINNIEQSEVIAKNLNISFGENKITADGFVSINKDSELKLSTKLVDLSKIAKIIGIEKILGTISLDTTIKGSLSNPHVILKSSIDDLNYNDEIKLKKLGINLDEQIDITKYSFNGKTQIDLTAFELLNSNTNISSAKLFLEGTSLLHKLSFDTNIEGVSQVKINMNGSLNDKQYSAIFNKLNFVTNEFGNWDLIKKLKLVYLFNEQKINFEPFAFSDKNQTILLKKGFYNLKDGSNDIDLQLKNFNARYLNKYLPDGSRIVTQLAGSVRVITESNKKPQINCEIVSKNGLFRNDTSSTKYKLLKIGLNTTQQGIANAFINFDSGRFGSFEITSSYDLNSDNHPLSKGVNLAINDLDVQLFSPFIDSVANVEGKIDSKGIFKCDKECYFDGYLNYSNGSIITEQDLVSATNINFKTKTTHDNLTIDGDFIFGDGKGNIQGNIDLIPIYTGELPEGSINIITDKAKFDLMGYGSAWVDTNLKIKMLHGKDYDLDSDYIIYAGGEVNIPSANILIEDIKDTGVSLSEDVEIVDDLDSANKEIKEKVKPQQNVFYNINVGIGPDVNLSAFGLKSAFDGKLLITNIKTEDHELNVLGKINFIDGRFKAFGQNLIVEKGNLKFDGIASSPYITFEAIRNPESITDGSGTKVGLRVFGYPSKIDLKVFSEPEMSEPAKMSYLLNGYGLTEDNSGSASSLALLLGATLSTASNSISSVTNQLGIKDFSLESSGSGDNSQVAASFYLTKKFKVSYGIGLMDSVSELKLRYELFSKFFVQFISSTDNAVDLFYNFSFD